MRGHLRFAPEILARLGEELVPHADLGILELVRNAYDADATSCHIRLGEASASGGTLTVSDNGIGMTADQLAEGFLLLGKSEKSSATHTAKGRRKVGEKGLGRLAALRLGQQVEVRTRPQTDPGKVHILRIDWTLFESAEAVEDVPLAIETAGSAEEPGTQVIVRNLRAPFGTQAAERLAHSLLLLSGPFRDESDFVVYCDTPEFDELAAYVNDMYLDDYEYKLVAVLNEEGQVSATLYNWRGEPEFRGGHQEVARARVRGSKDVPARFFSPTATFELWIFNLNPSKSHELRNAQQDTDAIKRWLARTGGVHLYHRGLRVQPYGDRGNDWLGINLRRAASPELRPSTNTSIGRVTVADPNDALRPKTDRSGFVESIEFHDLQDFAKRALDWAATQRLDKREQRREGKVAKQRDRADQAEERFRALAEMIAPTGDLDTLPLQVPADQDAVAAVISSALDTLEARKDETEAIREDLLLYRSLATVGTSTAVFAHESLRPSSRIITEVQTVRRRISRRIDADVFNDQFSESLDVAEQSAQTVNTFAKLPLSLLEKVKRSRSHVEIDQACTSVVQIFRRFLDERDIEVQLELDAPGSTVWTTIADIESILSNLIANAAHALTRDDAPRRKRLIRVRTATEDGIIELCFDDSGPGIHDMPLSEIWLPGKSWRDNGTGLGLTIVRDIVADLKGTREARREGDLGGARITIGLPISANGSGS